MATIPKGTIYKIIHRDTEEVIYVGSTCNYRNRKYQHKSTCNNPNGNRHHLQVYQHIRQNGGFDRFKFKRVKTYHDISKADLLAKERKYIQRLKPNTNVKNPICTDNERLEYRKCSAKREGNHGICSDCLYHWNVRMVVPHEQSAGHLRWVKTGKQDPHAYTECDECGHTYVVMNYKKHLKTQKHLKGLQ